VDTAIAETEPVALKLFRYVFKEMISRHKLVRRFVIMRGFGRWRQSLKAAKGRRAVWTIGPIGTSTVRWNRWCDPLSW